MTAAFSLVLGPDAEWVLAREATVTQSFPSYLIVMSLAAEFGREVQRLVEPETGERGR